MEDKRCKDDTGKTQFKTFSKKNLYFDNGNLQEYEVCSKNNPSQ